RHVESPLALKISIPDCERSHKVGQLFILP
ncbi:MAG: hypothetical protein ACI8RT_001495, partial [Candidatus Azotimanducaceae bacterium]